MYDHDKPLTDAQEKLLKKVYYEDKHQIGINALFKYIRENYPDELIYREQLTKWLNKQKSYQIHKRIPKKEKQTRMITSNKKGGIFQLDLIDMSNKPNRNFKYIIMLIDVYSRKLFAKAISNKTVKIVERELKILLDKVGISPKIIQTDNGNEFNFDMPENAKHLKSNSFSPQNQGVVERVNGTIKNVLYKVMDSNNSTNWIDLLDKVVENYNNHYHRILKDTPQNIWNGGNQPAERKHNKIADDDKDEVIPLNTYVRIKIQPNDPKKVKGRIWSEEIYKIVKIIKGKDFTRNRYKFENSEGKLMKNTLNNTKLLVLPNNNPEKKKSLK